MPEKVRLHRSELDPSSSFHPESGFIWL